MTIPKYRNGQRVALAQELVRESVWTWSALPNSADSVRRAIFAVPGREFTKHLELILLPRPVLIGSGTLGYSDANAVLRDISAVGAYCCTIMPLTRKDIELFVTLNDSLGASHLSFTGMVVRVENGPTDNSLGVGLRFSAFKEVDDHAVAA